MMGFDRMIEMTEISLEISAKMGKIKLQTEIL